MTANAISPNMLPFSAVVVVLATLIMWVSAGIVGVTKPSLLRSFIATIGVSLIAGAIVTAISSFGLVIAIVLGVVGVVGCLWVIRTVFGITTLPAFLVFIVNIMVQMILVSVYLRAMMQTAPKK
jgi:hypothetical protein